MKLSIARGTTSKILHVKLFDERSIKGDGLAGLLYNSSGLSAYYMRPGDTAPTQITLVTCTLGTWTSGGFKEVSAANMPGVYEIHLPNAALASGAASCFVQIKGAANLVQREIEIELTAVDNQTATFGLGAMTLTSAYDAAKTAAQAGNAMTLTSGERAAIATELLILDWATIAVTPASRCVWQALRNIRNAWDTDTVPGWLRVYKEDDTTEAWRRQLAVDPAAQPIIAGRP